MIYAQSTKISYLGLDKVRNICYTGYSDTERANMTELTYTSVQVQTSRRLQLEQLRLALSAERGEILLLRDVIDETLRVGMIAMNEQLAQNRIDVAAWRPVLLRPEKGSPATSMQILATGSTVA